MFNFYQFEQIKKVNKQKQKVLFKESLFNQNFIDPRKEIVQFNSLSANASLEKKNYPQAINVAGSPDNYHDTNEVNSFR